MNISRQAVRQRSHLSVILEKGEEQWLWARKCVMRDTTLAEWRKGETNLTSKQSPDEPERDWSPAQCGHLSVVKLQNVYKTVGCQLVTIWKISSLTNNLIQYSGLEGWYVCPGFVLPMVWSEIFPPRLQMSLNTNHSQHRVLSFSNNIARVELLGSNRTDYQ